MRRRIRALITVTAALLTACAGLQPPLGAPDVAPLKGKLEAKTDHGASWMLPDARKIKKLLYVSDWATNDVFVYNYQSGRLVGKLTGFDYPYGQCVDARGDVWITNYEGSSVVEYAHGAAKVAKSLPANQYSIGCAVDPTSGDLAVVTFTQHPELSVYPQASGSAKVYTDVLCDEAMWPPAYDKAGNVYVEGDNSGPYVCELPHGASSMRSVKFNVSIFYQGSVVWDGKYIGLTDQRYEGGYHAAIYQMTEDASGNLTSVGQTVLNDDCDSNYTDVIQPFVVGHENTPRNRRQGTVVVGGNVWCAYHEGKGPVDFWLYPSGGAPSRFLNKPPAEPYGQSVSIAP